MDMQNFTSAATELSRTICTRLSRTRLGVGRLAAKLALVAALFIGAMPGHGSAQSINIAAVVNDDVISIFDLSQRIGLIITFSNLPNTPETQQRIAPDVLRRLIVEKLHLQEAERLEIEVSEDDIANAIRNMEKKSDIPPNGMEAFLKSRGLDIYTLEQQFRAEQAWVRVVGNLFRRLVTISEQEVEDVLDAERAKAGKPQYLTAEIFLAFDEKPASEVQQVANRIHEQIAAGASWPQMAQNFSEAATAAQSGDMGWNTAADLGPDIGPVVAQLQPGQITPPLTTEDGVHIVLLRDQRTARGFEKGAADVTVGLHQLHVAIPPGSDPLTVSEITARTKSLAEGAANCESFSGLGESQGSELSGYLGEFSLDKLNPQFRSMVEALQPNQISQPLRTDNGVIVLMVCSRSTAEGGDPIAEAREKIRLQLLNERLSRMARQHEDKLRREAFIDIRL